MQNAERSRRLVLIYAAFLALSALLLLAWIFLPLSTSENAILFGMSLARLMLALGFLAVMLVSAVLFWKAYQGRDWAERLMARWFGAAYFGPYLPWMIVVGLGLGWTGAFLPAYRTGSLGSQWARLQPVMAFLLIVSAATLLLFLFWRNQFSRHTLESPDVFRLGSILFLASLPFLAATLYTKYEAYRLEDFWYGAGIPILASQLIGAILAGVLFLQISRKWHFRRLDLAIFIGLYVITALVWAREPLQRSFLFTSPMAPNKAFYPFADAAIYDTASQFGLIGQGIFIFNTPFFERTLYISFLIYLHSLFGQDYQTLMAAQAAVFAVLPPLIYAIGRSLNLRAAGFASAIIAVFRGLNAIAASRLTDTASPKMILTDFPTAIGVALIILFLGEWLKDPERNRRYALWTGGAIGLTLMLRTNALVFLPLIPLYALLKYGKQWKSWLYASALMCLAVIAITLPWELRNASRGAILYSPIVTKIRNVINTRYPPSAGPQGFISQETFSARVTLQNTEPISTLFSDAAQGQACQTAACFAPRHFLHNVVTSLLVLPTSPVLDDLRHAIKDSNPYWRADWNGRITFPSLLFFLLNVALIAFGVAAAWRWKHLPGITPLVVFTFYDVSNAFARTSGARYIVPIDWILTIYFVIGVLFVLKQLAGFAGLPMHAVPEREPEMHTSSRPAWMAGALVLLVLFVAGAFVPLAEKLNSPRYAGFDFTKALQEHRSQLEDAGLDLQQVNSFLRSPGAEMLVGRTLYPRSYKLGQGEFESAFYPYNNMDFPRTAFLLIGPKGADGVVLPGGFPRYFPHAADALVLGCRGQNFMDALAVIFLENTNTVYVRSPMPELTCPLQEPVCENNSVCQ